MRLTQITLIYRVQHVMMEEVMTAAACCHVKKKTDLYAWEDKVLLVLLLLYSFNIVYGLNIFIIHG